MICIDIDIHNSRLIFDAIIRGIRQINQWTISNNVCDKFPNPHWYNLPEKTARYFRLNLDVRKITWQVNDAAGREKLVDLRDVSSLEDAYELIAFVRDNDELFGNDIEEPVVLFKSKITKDDISKISKNILIKGAMEYVAKDIQISFAESMQQSINAYNPPWHNDKVFTYFKTKPPADFHHEEKPMWNFKSNPYNTFKTPEDNPYQMTPHIKLDKEVQEYIAKIAAKVNVSIGTIDHQNEITQKQVQDSWDAVMGANMAWSLNKK